MNIQKIVILINIYFLEMYDSKKLNFLKKVIY